MTALTSLPVVADMLSKSRMQIQHALPNVPGLSVDRLIRVALTEFSKNPRLRECSPVSFCSAVVQAAQMGLEFGELKHCALVPYKDECKLMVQYQGWMALLWRSGAVKDIQARVVYEGDEFDVMYGSEAKLIHVPRFRSSKPLVYWAGATTAYGQFMFEIMTLEHIEAHMKQYARGLDKKDSPWNTSFDAMALKTVMRKLIKLMNISADSPVVAAMAADEKIWEADKQESRMDKFHAISAAPDLPKVEDIADVKRPNTTPGVTTGVNRGNAPIQESTYE